MPKRRRTSGVDAPSDPAIPTWGDIKRDLRALFSERVRFLGIELRYRGGGMGDPREGLKSRVAPWELPTFAGFGGKHAGGGRIVAETLEDGRSVGYYVLVATAPGAWLADADSCREMLGTLAAAGLRLRGPSDDVTERDGDPKRWFRRLFESGAGAEPYQVTGVTSANAPVDVEVHEVRDLVRSSIELIERIEAQGRRRGRRPTQESDLGRVREFLRANRGRWFRGDALKREAVSGRPLAGVKQSRMSDHASRCVREHGDEFERRERAGAIEYRAR